MELSDDALRSIVAHFAHLHASYGEALAKPDLVEPNGDYFPDVFDASPKAIERLMRRMMTYAPLSTELDVELGFVEPSPAQGGSSCSTGGCGSSGSDGAAAKGGVLASHAADGSTHYAVLVATGDAVEPKLLAASLARSMGRMVLFEANEDVDPRVEGALSELTAVASGLGVLLFNGSAVYKKGCGGVRRHQGTVLGVTELALACALFVRMHGHKASAIRRHLEVTQREAFDIALDWVDGQPKLVQRLVELPESLVDGVFVLEQKKGLFGRLFGSPKKASLDDFDGEAAVAQRSVPVRSAEELRRIEETRALVEEALQE
jgi:hypothetical protein